MFGFNRREEILSGGYLYLDFATYRKNGMAGLSWAKAEYYTQSLEDQYDAIKRKLGVNAPETLNEFVERCFPEEEECDYYISMPGFDRAIDDSTPNIKRVKNVVIRPDLSLSYRREVSLVPQCYDVIVIGNIVMTATTISLEVKGIELIDSKVLKHGELHIRCCAMNAFSLKTLNTGKEVAKFSGNIKDPVLTRDFIDKLCNEVYPIENYNEAIVWFEKAGEI